MVEIAAAHPTLSRRYGVRTITPPILAHLLEVKVDTVMAWIRSGNLPALNIGTTGKRASYRIFRKDAVLFLQRQGLALDRIQEVLGLPR